jgi:hypothetical protein
MQYDGQLRSKILDILVNFAQRRYSNYELAETVHNNPSVLKAVVVLMINPDMSYLLLTAVESDNASTDPLTYLSKIEQTQLPDRVATIVAEQQAALNSEQMGLLEFLLANNQQPLAIIAFLEDLATQEENLYIYHPNQLTTDTALRLVQAKATERANKIRISRN